MSKAGVRHDKSKTGRHDLRKMKALGRHNGGMTKVLWRHHQGRILNYANEAEVVVRHE